jgi:hypothetical protein
MGDLARAQGEGAFGKPGDDADKGDYSESNYDSFSGYGGSVSSALPTWAP